MRAAAAAGGLLAALVAGCGSPPPSHAPVVLPRPSPITWADRSASPSASSTFTRRSGLPEPLSTGWQITVYYTAVEKYHHGRPVRVTGCPELACTHGTDDLGTYPADFVSTVKTEGAGRTTSGRYLNWSYDTGFWLDSAPRDTDGAPLEPFISAGADRDVLPHGTTFTIAECGRQEDGSALVPTVCAALRKAKWRIADEFTPGLGGRKHIDAYIGPETGPTFTQSDWYITVTDARLTLP
jgi:hypothetical protein